ncbi:hypothetical protein [Notoacmeibacter marinus]|uniref:hypothetical protein n=1 Tax=Notoacmeibacter marinus TaxID=1876515 RepID=UPI000DF398B7|nr:hypothetical protein [Notoacmeibacter marinus]
MTGLSGIVLLTATITATATTAEPISVCESLPEPKMTLTIEEGNSGKPVTFQVPRSFDGFGYRNGMTRGALLLEIDNRDLIRLGLADIKAMRLLMSKRLDIEWLVSLRSYDEFNTNRPVSSKPFAYGLRKLDLPVKHGGHIQYIHRENGRMVDYIFCSDPKDVPVPQCRHVIEMAPIDVQISYAATYLPQWAAIRRTVAAMIECFHKQPAGD